MKNSWIILRLVLVTLWYSAVAIIVAPFDRRHRFFFRYSRSWAATLLRIAGVTVSVEGDTAVPRGGNLVYVSNHASLFDIPVLIASIDDNIRIMYKRELRRIPVFGWILALSPYIPVDRSDPRDAMAGIERAAQNIRDGGSVVIFAEGTRSKDGTLGPFKRGAFLLAARAHRPVVPVAIVGSSAILPSKTSTIHPGHVRLVLHSPATIKGDTAGRAAEKELMNTVRSVIAAELGSE